MSIAGLASSVFSQLSSLQNSKQNQGQIQFQKLAQDLQPGNLSAAQADFDAPQKNAAAGQSGSANPLAQAFKALSTDLKAGNLPAAQKDFATIQQDVARIQQGAQQGGQIHHHHHHHAAETQGGATTSTQQNAVAQLFSTLGQDLQTGNLSNAQQAYAALQRDLPFLGAGAAAGATPSAAGAVNLSA